MQQENSLSESLQGIIKANECLIWSLIESLPKEATTTFESLLKIHLEDAKKGLINYKFTENTIKAFEIEAKVMQKRVIKMSETKRFAPPFLSTIEKN